MFVKFAVFLIAVILVFVFMMIIRQRSSKVSNQNNKGNLLNEKIDWSETLNDLPLPQLKYKLLDLEKQKDSTSSGFINMNTIQKNDAIGRVSNINEKIEKVKQEIEERQEWDSAKY